MVTVEVAPAAVPAPIGAGSRPPAEVARIAAALAQPWPVAPLSEVEPVERSDDCLIAVQQEAAEAEGEAAPV